MIMKSELARGHRTNTHKTSLTTHNKSLGETLYGGLARQRGTFQAGFFGPLKGKYHIALSLLPVTCIWLPERQKAVFEPKLGALQKWLPSSRLLAVRLALSVK